ncbi:ras-related protein Rap-2a-like [Xenia sp. Carnegie-2017]|uniref:ras-related protein Rap-2a-like n=1 Tax=Xenia sp. Carnegie-2017 TaxID=2897299 RepID=UPI001F04DD87|nr:ras-related protein Rap-2a-like [Xenia sp. Carnegie-2017]
MNRQRKKAIAHPTVNASSLNQNNFLRSFYSSDKAEDDFFMQPQMRKNKNNINKYGQRRCSVNNMTLTVDPERRRKHSFQIGAFRGNRARTQQPIEDHFTVILGAPSVGKTALVVRYVTGRFVHEYDPTLERIYEKQQEIGNVKGLLRIMDTAGSIENCNSYVRKAEGIVVVYSITDRNSFEVAKDYLNTTKEYQRLGTPFDYKLPTILVGNKRELRRAREVGRYEGRETAKKLGCLFIESSAAYDRNVQKIFLNMFLQIQQIKQERQTTIVNNAGGFVNTVKNFFQTKKK